MSPRGPALALWLAACVGGSPADSPPVLQGTPEVVYPPDLFSQGVSGTTQLHLFIDSTGAVVAESTRISQSSGTAALDSAALAAVSSLQYTPGIRDGRPAAMPLLQPIHFQSRP